MACLLAFPACQAGPATWRTDGEREVALPPWVAAAVVGAALRAQLPFADPRPQERGVPVLRLGPEAGRFAFHGDGRTAVPLASHRLSLQPGAEATADLQPVLTALPAALVAHGSADLCVDVRRGPLGARVTGMAPPCVWRAIDEALATLLEPAAAHACPTAPDLALVQQHLLARAIAAAQGAGDRDRAHVLRQRCAQRPQAPTAVHAALGRIAADSGDLPAAHDHAWFALLASTDPTARARMARNLTDLQARGDDAERWRRAARERMHTDPFAAAALLHHARRLRPEPVADYRLASRLHALAADPARAVPDALLAREHAATDLGLATYLAELWLAPQAQPAAAAPSR